MITNLEHLPSDETAKYGNKAANLARLVQAGLPVPSGVAVSLEAFDEFGALKPNVVTSLQQLSPDYVYAVRSSALGEDADGASWAGQFESFLNIPFEKLQSTIEACHASAKLRAQEYALETKASVDTFKIAVVVQQMLIPDYAGVLFTVDPVSGAQHFVAEYIEGLGEELVSGRVDPTRIVLDGNQTAPFDTKQLADLGKKVVDLFDTPQDIEWASAEGKVWLLQARPITTLSEKRQSYYIGEPEELFYWGPTRAKPLYMSDFMAAADRLFIWMASEPELPTPPKSVTLFYDNKMVWLNNAAEFAQWTEDTFEAYLKFRNLDDDINAWHQLKDLLPSLTDPDFTNSLVDAWFCTIFAEFSLYGAESALSKRLTRFDADTRQQIWTAFTVPDQETFIGRIDRELAQTQDPEMIATKYPWINDGYDGPGDGVEDYFKKRLAIVGTNVGAQEDYYEQRKRLTAQLDLTDDEITALTMARRLAEFMDDRKAWMMQSRRLLTQNCSNITDGWFFDGVSESSLIDVEDTAELWQRYVDFKASTNAVSGIVASNGGKHFVNGEVFVVSNPTDAVPDGAIVVVPFTSPSYVPLMRKAKALITDHGGIMSHAAIVAREFNLPCVVGTKQATKVLKTGDKVVIDLVRGEINK